MNFDYIPEGAEKEELDTYIEFFWKNKNSMLEEKGTIYLLEQLSKIAEHYSYYKLDDDEIISNFLIESIDFNNKDNLELISFIALNMYLTKVINYMKENISNVEEFAKKIIEETINEEIQYSDIY